MIKNIGDIIFGCVSWWFFGFGLAFGDESEETKGKVIASGNIFMKKPNDHAFWFFQFSF